MALPNSIPSVLATLALVTRPISSVPTINWVYWSLTYEIVYYLAVGLLLKAALVGGRSFERVLGVGVIMLSILAAIAAPFAEGTAAGWSSWNPLLILLGWPMFALGLGFAIAEGGRRDLGRFACLSAIGAMLAAIFATGTWIYPCVAVCTLVAIGLAARARQPAPRPLVWLGERSYSLYLIHVPIGCYLGGWVLVPDISSGWTYALGQGFRLFLCLAVANLFYKLFEAPFTRLGEARASATAGTGIEKPNEPVR